jgi:CheY-like chemotaxis protein
MASRPVPRIFVVDGEYVMSSTRACAPPEEASAAAHEAPPDLPLADVAMPGLTGIDLAIQKKVLSPTRKILLFSGRTDTLALRADARRRGHHLRLLVKAVPPSELLVEVGNLLGKAQLPPRGDGKAGLRLVRSRRTSTVQTVPGKNTRKLHLIEEEKPKSFPGRQDLH